MDDEIKKEVVKRKTVKKVKKETSYLAQWIIVGVLIIISGIILFFNLKALGYFDKFSSKNEGYHLISLNSGSGNVFYYGQIIDESRETITLKDPGYLDVQAGRKRDE